MALSGFVTRYTVVAERRRGSFRNDGMSDTGVTKPYSYFPCNSEKMPQNGQFWPELGQNWSEWRDRNERNLASQSRYRQFRRDRMNSIAIP